MHRPLEYRRDIEGLRGLALLLVLAYHLQVTPIRGGYIGVDIFYVISGYLITSLLQKEQAIVAPLANFYARRIKRFLPMFLVFSIVTTIVAAVLLLPDDFVLYLKSLREALLFKSNFFFDSQAKDYFGASARELPLLHTWSLSIEWQFYLLFPLPYLAAHVLLGKRSLTILLFCAAAILALLSVVVTRTSTDAYFLTSARFFEPMFGACLTQLDPRKLQRVGTALVLPCIAGLLGLALIFNPAASFPGTNAVVVCCLSAVIVLFGDGNKFLSSRWLVHVGRISYSAYLWHWPFIAFLTYLNITISPLLALGIAAIVLLLADVSYRVVEEPYRRSRIPFRSVALAFFIVPASLSIAAVKIGRAYDGFPQRLGAESVHAYNLLRPYQSNNQRKCHDYNGEDIYKCAFGDPTSSTLALLIGDSHARHYWWFVNLLAKQAHVKVIGLSYSECLMLPGAHPAVSGLAYPGCAEVTRRVFGLIREKKFNYVLIGERWMGYPSRDVELLSVAVKKIVAGGATPVILGPVAEDGTNKKDCFYRHIKLRRAASDDCSIDSRNSFARDAMAYIASLFEHVQKSYPSTIIVAPQAVQCDNGRCATVIDDAPIYVDTHHLNGFGSTVLAREYIERFGNPLMGQTSTAKSP